MALSAVLDMSDAAVREGVPSSVTAGDGCKEAFVGNDTSVSDTSGAGVGDEAPSSVTAVGGCEEMVVGGGTPASGPYGADVGADASSLAVVDGEEAAVICDGISLPETSGAGGGDEAS